MSIALYSTVWYKSKAIQGFNTKRGKECSTKNPSNVWVPWRLPYILTQKSYKTIKITIILINCDQTFM